MDAEMLGLDAWIESVESRLVERSHKMTCKHCGQEVRISHEEIDYVVDSSNSARCPVNGFQGHAQANGQTHSVTGEHTMGRIINNG